MIQFNGAQGTFICFVFQFDNLRSFIPKKKNDKNKRKLFSGKADLPRLLPTALKKSNQTREKWAPIQKKLYTKFIVYDLYSGIFL